MPATRTTGAIGTSRTAGTAGGWHLIESFLLVGREDGSNLVALRLPDFAHFGTVATGGFHFLGVAPPDIPDPLHLFIGEI